MACRCAVRFDTLAAIARFGLRITPQERVASGKKLEPDFRAFRIEFGFTKQEVSGMRSGMNGLMVLAGLIVVGLIQTATTGQAPPNMNNDSFETDLGDLDGVPRDRPGLVPAARMPQVTASASAEGVMAFAAPNGTGGQLITVIDARRSWMAVYSVDVGDQQIRMLSSRPLSQDFSVQYNVADPTPADIQRLQSP